MVSLSSARDASAAARMTCAAGTSFTLNGSPSVSLFWVRVPVLSAHSTSTPASSSMATRRLTIACFLARRRAPTAIVTDSTVGIATGIAATVSTRANCSVVRIAVAAKDGEGDDHGDQRHRQDDQVVADLQHRALKVTDRVRLLHELRGLAEVRLVARGVDQRADLALADDGPREHRIARLALGRQRLARQGGLIHLDRVPLQQPRVRRHDVPQAHAYHVARHELSRRRSDPLAVTLHPGLDGQLGLQGGDRVAGLALLPESDDGVGAEQNEDDAEVRPVPGDRREDHGRLDHPRNRAPEVRQELQQRIGLLLLDLVGPVLGEPLLSLRLTEPIRRRAQLGLELRHGHGLHSVLGVGRGADFAFGAFCWAGGEAGFAGCCRSVFMTHAPSIADLYSPRRAAELHMAR